MAKSVGIDGGECSVNVVGLDGSYRKTRLLACRVEPLSGGGVEAEKTIEAAGTIATALREGRIKGELVLGHPCDDAVLRKIVLPFSGRDALRKVIKSEAENAIHSHSIDDMVVDFHELGENEGGSRVLLAAVPKPGLRSLLTSLQHEGVEPERVELDTMALFRAADWCGAFEHDATEANEVAVAVEEGNKSADAELPSLEKARLTAVLDIGDRSTRVLLVADGKLVDMRTIRLGGSTVVDGIARAYQLPLAEAREATAACLAVGGDFEIELQEGSGDLVVPSPDGNTAEDGGEAPAGLAQGDEPAAERRGVTVTLDDVQAMQTDFLQRLGRELVRFLTAADVRGDVVSLWVAGSACRVQGMREMLSEAFGTEPRELDVLANLKHSLPEEEAHELSPRLATAVGLALANLGGPLGFDFRQEDLVFTRGFDRIKFPLAIACFCGLFAAIVFAVKLQNELQNLEYRLGSTFQGPEADENKPVFYGQLGEVLSWSRFEDDRFFSRRDGSRNYGYRELLKDLANKPVPQRIPFARNKLRQVLDIKQEESGIYENVALESGLSVILRFFEVLKRAEPAMGKYVLCSLQLNLAASATNRKLEFVLAIRGADFRLRQSSLLAELENECTKPDSPFKEVSLGRGGEMLFKDGREKNIQGAYFQFDLSIRESFSPVKVGP